MSLRRLTLISRPTCACLRLSIALSLMLSIMKGAPVVESCLASKVRAVRGYAPRLVASRLQNCPARTLEGQ